MHCIGFPIIVQCTHIVVGDIQCFHGDWNGFECLYLLWYSSTLLCLLMLHKRWTTYIHIYTYILYIYIYIYTYTLNIIQYTRITSNDIYIYDYICRERESINVYQIYFCVDLVMWQCPTATRQETFCEYRACELKHGRVAMMAPCCKGGENQQIYYPLVMTNIIWIDMDSNSW